ncbi:hypothetical protein AcW1_009891 [Taiwanofungus camphoratus]|nr:hypothetical protein AcW1_009891 [Antrodia cinnamomea]
MGPSEDDGDLMRPKIPPSQYFSLSEGTQDPDFRSASSTQPRVFALIIAIDKYKNPDDDLSGCENDGRKIESFLLDVLLVPPSHIVFLTNEGATRAAILSAFKSHLIDNEKIQKGDAIVFFYAGHGSRVQAPPQWLAENNMVETICPHDDGEDIEGDLTPGIPDRTFDGLMRHLAHNKGDNIIAIFDSCHSGGMSRANTNVKTRFRPPSSPSFCLPDRIDQEIWQWGLSSRTATAVVPTGFLYKAMASHVLLAACRQDEIALETRDTTEPGGAFTTALVKTLRSCDLGQITYDRLMELLPVLPYQHPQCEGINKHRILFNGSILKDSAKTFKVVKRGDDCYVQAGSIHGVIVGTEFKVQPPTNDFRTCSSAMEVILVAIHVDALRCNVKRLPEGIPFDIPDGTRAVVSKWNMHQLKVHFQLPKGNLFTTVSAHERCDVSVIDNGPDGLQLRRLDPLISRHANLLVDVKQQERISDILDAVAHFNYHLYRLNKSAPLKNKFTVRLHRLQRESWNTYRPIYNPTGDDLLAADSEPVVCDANTLYDVKEVKEAVIYDLESYYGLTLENYSDYDLFPYVFYFDPSDYSIQPWYLPPSETMSAPLPRLQADGQPSKFPVGYGASGTDSILFSLPPGATSDSGFLKVFVSTKYVSMDGIKQLSPINDPSRQAIPTVFPFDELWDAWVIVLTCCKIPQSAVARAL